MSRSPPEARLASAYNECFPVIADKCRRMLRDVTEAHDVAQEVFLKLWQTAPQLLDRPDELAAWIFRASTRLAIDRLRRRNVRAAWQPDASDVGIDLEASTAAKQQLLRLVGSCADDELAVAILSRLDGLEQREISQILQVSERTVRRLLARFDERAAKEVEP